MRSIYSTQRLQHIVDHWGIGEIVDISKFGDVTESIWRHQIETNQGEFELYSYPLTEEEDALSRLKEFYVQKLRWDPRMLDQQKIIQSFDRCHILVQKTVKEQISYEQALEDLDMLIGLTIQKAFRVYGTIFQMHLGQANADKIGTLECYASWSIVDIQEDETSIIADSNIHSKDQLDEAIRSVEAARAVIEKHLFSNGQFELQLSNEMRLCFKRSDVFPAIELDFNSKQNALRIVDENKFIYSRYYKEL